jgi:hypothetical protein
MIITCQHEWVEQCQLRYKVDPPSGYHWEDAHYPTPLCLNGIKTKRLWYPDHIVHGAIQTLNLQHPCMHGFRVKDERRILSEVYPEYLSLYEEAYSFCQKFAGRRCAELGAGVTGYSREERVAVGKKAKPKRGKENGMYGKTHTEEARKIQREAANRQNQTMTEEEKQERNERLRLATLKRHESYSEEDKKELYGKVSQSLQGRKRYVNERGERLYQREHPGEGWQRGLHWRQHD